jgi:eukaryotic-like serine/threonine-protein kinase
VIVWTDRGGREHVKVCDFGIAKIIDGEGSSITVDGFVCGTPQYMAPEQARGDTIDYRLDVYAAGVVLYQMLCGVVPFTGDTALGIITRHLTDDPIPPSERKPEWNIPSSLEAIALRAMQKAPADRYPTAGAMADAIDEAVKALGDDAKLKMDEPGLKKYAERAKRSPSRSDTTAKTSRGASPPVPTDSQIRPAVIPQRSLAPWVGLVLVVGFGLGAAYVMGAFDGSPAEVPVAEPEDPPSEPEPAPEPVPVEVIPTGEETPPPEVTPPPEAGASEVEPRPSRGGRAPVASGEATSGETTSEAPTPSPTPEPAAEAMTPYDAAFAEGRRRFLANDVAGAIESFEEAARLSPRSAEVQKQLGRAYMRAGDTARSVAAYRRYLELAPDAADRAVIEAIIAGH